MQAVAIKLYERLKEKLGSEEATLLIDFIDERVKGEVATKEDIHGLKEEIHRLDKRISDLEWKLKLYFILLAVLIVITNPGALEFFGKIIGVVK